MSSLHPTGATSDVSLTSLWMKNWAKYPSKIAIRNGDRSLTFSELESKSSRLQHRLSEQFGITVGTKVMIDTSPSIDFVLLLVAILRNGGIVIPINSSCTYHELATFVDVANPSLYHSHDPQRAAFIESKSVRVIDGQVLVQAEENKITSAAATTKEPTSASTAIIAFTSGTTGTPKGVLITHGAIVQNLNALQSLWGITEQDKLYLSLPLFHIHGLVLGLFGQLTAMSEVFLDQRFDPGTFLHEARQGRITLFYGVPTMYARLLQHSCHRDLSRLRLCVSGSAALTSKLFQDIETNTNQTILERYGMTETLIISSNPLVGKRKPSTVGQPLGDTRLTFTNDNEIRVQSPSLLEKYIGLNSTPIASRDEEGAFSTGDLGHLDEDGYLVIDGRKKELIISGGHNIYPKEVEDVLLAFSGVVDAAVVGRKSDLWGEEVIAYIVTQTDHDTEEIKKFASRYLARYKLPKAIHFVDELPKNSLGKVQKHLLH